MYHSECIESKVLPLNLIFRTILLFSLSPSFLLPPTPGSLPNLSRQMMGDTIIFRSVQMGSSAVYQCNASNQHGYLLANAFVSVLGETQRVEVDFKM